MAYGWEDRIPSSEASKSDVIDTLLAIIDAPGGMARNLFASKDLLSGLFDPAKRATGKDVLRNMGSDDPSDFASTAVDGLLDPLLLLGPPRRMLGGGLKGLAGLFK